MGPSTMAREEKQDDVSNATFTARSYALGSGHSADPQQTSSHVDEATRATTDLGPTGDELPRENAGRRLDHSLAGAGIGGAGAGYVGADELQEFMRHGRDPEADQATYAAREHYVGSSSDSDPFQRPGHELYSADKGPAGVRSAGEMAPGHVPGEFPTDDGSDPHRAYSGPGTGSSTAAGLGTGAGAGTAGVAASRAYNDRNTIDTNRGPARSEYPTEQPSSPIQTTTNTMRSGSFSKPSETTTSEPRAEERENSGGFRGALAAATAAMGLGGAGAYAASRDDRDDSTSKTAEPAPSSRVTRGADPSSVAPGSVVSDQTQSYTHHRPGTESLKPTSTPATTVQPQQPERADNTARNAALGASAVGATGAGAYALSQDRDRNDPQSVVSDTTQRYTGSHPSDGTSTQPMQVSSTSRDLPPRQPEQEDHTSRNAALGAGGLAGAGAGAYAMNNNDINTPSTANSDNVQSVVSDKTQSYHRSHPGDNNPALQPAPTTGASSQPAQPASMPSTSHTQRPKEDDTTRNAALGAGGVAGAGAGAYALSNRDESNIGTGGSVVSPDTQKYTGSHPSDTTSSYKPSGTTSTQITDVQSQRPREEDHTARNSALGAGGVGAAGAGAGAYALSDRDNSSPSNAQSVVSPETQKYTGSHPSDGNPSYQPSSKTSSQTPPTVQSQQPREEDHTARNAALGAGGVGAVGAGAYALSNRNNNNADNAPSVVSPETQKYAGSHPSDTSPPYQSSGTSVPGSQAQPTSYSQQPREEGHTGRNAALGAGAVGAAGAGGYALGRDDEKTSNAQSVVSPETQKYTGSHPHDSKTQPTSSSRTTAPVSSSRPKTTPDYSRSPAQPSEEDHTARNAALGAGGMGAAGAGAYALSQDDDRTDNPRSVISPDTQRYAGSHPQHTNTTTTTTTTTSQAPISRQYGGGATNYSRPSERMDDSAMEGSVLGAGSNSYPRPQSEDHTSRNAALSAGGVGAAGAGAYAMGRRGDDTGPASKTLGPHESNAANVVDPRVRPEPTQQFEKTTDGPYESNIANRVDPRVTSGPAGTRTEPQSHNYGRDAAVVGGTGAAGAAGYGAYEYANRGDPTQQYAQPQQVQHRTPPQETYRQAKPEKARETRETYQREPKYEKESKFEEHDPRVAAGSDGHNKLHKKGVEQEVEHTGRNAALGAGGAGAVGHGAKEYYDNKSDSHDTTDSQEQEKKHGFMHKILHPREHKREKEEEEARHSSDNRRSYEQAPSSSAAASPAVATGPSGTGEARGGSVTEPHTGLPMDVGKYGTTGAGGTDGAPQIEGYHEPRSEGGAFHGSSTQRM